MWHTLTIIIGVYLYGNKIKSKSNSRFETRFSVFRDSGTIIISVSDEIKTEGEIFAAIDTAVDRLNSCWHEEIPLTPEIIATVEATAKRGRGGNDDPETIK